jgi:hypothetical protein
MQADCLDAFLGEFGLIFRWSPLLEIPGDPPWSTLNERKGGNAFDATEESSNKVMLNFSQVYCTHDTRFVELLVE